MVGSDKGLSSNRHSELILTLAYCFNKKKFTSQISLYSQVISVVENEMNYVYVFWAVNFHGNIPFIVWNLELEYILEPEHIGAV